MSDGKALWNVEGVPVCTEGDVQQVPMLVSDGVGGAIAYWLDYREDFGNTTEDAIYAQRIEANGTPLWKENGVSVCAAKKEQISPRAVPIGDSTQLWFGAMHAARIMTSIPTVYIKHHLLFGTTAFLLFFQFRKSR